MDFTAVMMTGAAIGADQALLAELLPDIERTIVIGLNEGGEGDG